MSALNLIGNEPLQQHWVKRFLAALIDWVIFVVIGIALAIFLLPFYWVTGGWWWGPTAWIGGLLWVLYAFFLEMTNGATLGKQLLGLRVVTMDGQKINATQALVRNVSKIYSLLWFLDWLVGFAMDGDPRQKFTDRAVGITVTRTDQMAYLEEQFRQMGKAPGYQPPPFQGPVSQGPPVYGAPPAAVPPAQPAQPPAYAATPQTPAPQPGWPPQQAPPGQWPQHQWNQQGQLQPQNRFCSNCGGELVPRGDGRMTCVRCGAVY
jgi:uncharacterized RDD family membrane protein YckC/ribosomal protein S27AE